ncbi:MAG: glycosyltransferase [Armatimonadetes bacterium]|nr:glycosyltransferase [Armatimonadota bacterium]
MITVLDLGASLGHANHFLSIAREFSKLGHRLGLIVPRPASGGESLPVERAEWQFTLPARRLGLPNNLSTFCQILPILLRWKTTGIDILYVRASMFSFIYGMLFRLSRKTIVISEHNGWYEDERRSLDHRTWLCGLERVCQVLDATFADRLRVVTKEIKQLLVTHGVDPKKIHVIPNGTDPDSIRPIAREKALGCLGLDPSLFYVGFLGHLTPWQGVEVAIEAMANLVNEDAHIRLLIGGDGIMREPLESRVRDCGLGHRVIFLGAVPRGRVCEVLSSFDVAIAPFVRRRNERSGSSALKIRDYAAAGRAVVAADLPGIREFAEAGWLVLHRPDDPKSLAEEILNLLHDPARRREMGCKARTYAVANLSWGLTAKKILNMIKN